MTKGLVCLNECKKEWCKDCKPPCDSCAINQIEKALKEYEQYKAIEQEIGIDLITLVKTLKNGCYVKPWKEIKYTYEIRTGSDNINLFLLDENDNDYSLKDYGKTWALTKEELL